jgi:hypothetical protein
MKKTSLRDNNSPNSVQFSKPYKNQNKLRYFSLYCKFWGESINGDFFFFLFCKILFFFLGCDQKEKKRNGIFRGAFSNLKLGFKMGQVAQAQ